MLPGNGAAGGGGLGKGGRDGIAPYILIRLDGNRFGTMFVTLHALMRAIPALRLLNVAPTR